MEPDERLDFRIGTCTRVHRILQEISDQNTEFRFRDHRRVIHLDGDLHGDPVFFCLFRVEGEDRVDGIIFTVGADLLRLEDFLDHIKTCENCREELEIHYMVDVGLKKLDEADGTYDIVGDLKRKVAESYRSLRHISTFQIASYAISTLCGMALIVMILLQLRIWTTMGYL